MNFVYRFLTMYLPYIVGMYLIADAIHFLSKLDGTLLTITLPIGLIVVWSALYYFVIVDVIRSRIL